MLILLAIGAVLVSVPNSTKYTLNFMASFLQTPYRESIITLFALVIGLLHFYHIGRNNEKHKEGVTRTFAGVFASIGAAIGYSVLMNRCINLALGVAFDFFGMQSYFINSQKVDHVTILLVVALIIGWSGYGLWKLAEEFLYEIGQHPVDVEAIAPPDSQQEDNKPKDD